MGPKLLPPAGARSVHEPRETAALSPFPDPRGVLSRNRWLILGCVVVALSATAFFTSRLAPVYRAVASIRIDDARSRLTAVDPLGLTAGGEITTEVEMLRSRMLAEAVVDSLGLQLRVAQPTRVARAALFGVVDVSRQAVPARYSLARRSDGRFVVRDSAGSVLGVSAPDGAVAMGGATFRLSRAALRHPSIEVEVQSFEDAVDLLQKNLEVARRSREAQIVDVRYEDSDPGLVRDVPNVLARRFIADRQDVHQSQARSTVRFLRSQIEHLSGQLASAENTLRDFREGAQVVSLPDQASSEVRRAAELKAQRDAMRTESAALSGLLAEARAAAARQGGEGTSPYRNLVAFPTLLRNQAASSLLTSIAAAEDRRAELLTRRNLEDADVKILTGRIEQLEAQLQGIAETYVRGLDGQIVGLDRELASAGQSLQAIPAKETRFAQLSRDAKVLEEIYTQLQGRLKEAEVAAAVEDPAVRLIDGAIAPRAPIRPRPLVNLSLALVAGLLLGVSGAFVRERADRTVHTRLEVLAMTGLPVLGLIPRADRSAGMPRMLGMGRRKLYSGGRPMLQIGGEAGDAPDAGAASLLLPGADPWSPFAEAYNRLETNVSFASSGSEVKLVVVTSPLPGEGKTTSAVNYAITLAQRGQRVLLVDADVRRGVLDQVLQQPRSPGLSDTLLGTAALGDAIRSVPVGAEAELHLLPAGTLPQNPAQLLRSSRMMALLEVLRDKYDAIVLDAPPLNLVTDAALLGAHSDGVLVVVRSGTTPTEALAFTMEQLHNVQAPVLGVILNDVDFERDAVYDRSYHYYGYHRAYAQRG